LADGLCDTVLSRSFLFLCSQHSHFLTLSAETVSQQCSSPLAEGCYPCYNCRFLVWYHCIDCRGYMASNGEWGRWRKRKSSHKMGVKASIKLGQVTSICLTSTTSWGAEGSWGMAFLASASDGGEFRDVFGRKAYSCPKWRSVLPALCLTPCLHPKVTLRSFPHIIHSHPHTFQRRFLLTQLHGQDNIKGVLT
jgi:hypothetical protein